MTLQFARNRDTMFSEVTTLNDSLPQRKEMRLKRFDYNSPNAYFLTICIKERQQILSKIILGKTEKPEIVLTNVGSVIERNVLSIDNTGYASVDHYVIMPDHIHLILRLNGIINETGNPTNQTIPHIVSTFKRLCTKEIGENVFQRSYYDHIIRDRDDYETRMKYIYENPVKWYYEGK